MLDGGSLLLLVTPSGGKLGRWNYLYDGKQKSMAFRAWPLVSLADAREVPRRRRRYRR
ncbi:Arm DNA-binding domain-containing protein [Sphingopyxis sp. LARHCG72]